MTPTEQQKNQSAAYLWGLAKDGTNLVWDIFLTFLAVVFAVLIVDLLLPDSFQEAQFALANAFIITCGGLMFVLAWGRMRKDNKNRAAAQTN